MPITKLFRAVLAATVVTLAATSASAEGLRPTQARDIDARGIDLGAVSGVVYYTAEADGFRVVATLEQSGEDATPVRVEAVLAPGQSLVLSTPREVGVPPEAVEISRQADTVLVRRSAAVVTD